MRSPRAVVFAAVLSLIAVACVDATEPNAGPDILAGLTEATPQDSAGNPVSPPTGGTEGAGYIRGTVRGPNAPGTGGDTLATSPRIAGVVVRAYRITGYSATGPVLGPLAAEATTNAQGAFTLPSVPSGNYAVAFIPAGASGYLGTWATAPIHPTSHEWPWWVTLPRS